MAESGENASVTLSGCSCTESRPDITTVVESTGLAASLPSSRVIARDWTSIRHGPEAIAAWGRALILGDDMVESCCTGVLTGVLPGPVLWQALNTADSYTITGDVLVLNKAKMAPLARFKSVYMK